MASWHRYASWLFSLTVGLLLLPGASPAADSTPELRQPQLLSQPLHRLPGTAEATDGPGHPTYRPAAARPATGKLDDSWQEPAALIAALQELAGRGMAGQWSSRVAGQINRLRPTMADDPTQAAAILGQLGGEADETLALAARRSTTGHLPANSARPGWRWGVGWTFGGACWLLCGAGSTRRRHAAAGPRRANGLPGRRGCRDGQLARRPGLAGVPVHRRAAPLCLAHAAARRSGDCGERRSCAVAADANALDRGAAAVRLFRTAGRAARGAVALGRPTVGAAALLGDIERYEMTELPSDARRLAIDCQFLMASSVAARRELGLQVDSIYRNANVRISVSERLLNDLMPPREPEYQSFAETVLGHPVQGVSLAKSQTAVRMLPDPNRALLALQVTGKIVASSTSQAGPARFRNDSQSTYVATEEIQIDMKGVTLFPVEVGVNNDTQLRGINTSWLDPSPSAARWSGKSSNGNITRTRKPPRTRWSRSWPPGSASGSMHEAREKLSGVVERLNQRVFDPLNTLAVGPATDFRPNDGQTVLDAAAAGRRQPPWQPHASAPSPGRQPGERAAPRVGVRQRHRADAVGRPHLHHARNCRSTSPNV